MRRIYESLLSEHLDRYRQMAFLSGPRQVGKTTTSRASAAGHRYYTWDRPSDRRLIARGPDATAEDLELSTVRSGRLPVVFTEIHKYRHWKSFLKGFFDVYGEQVAIIVTGSARLAVYKRGADSLMGRYFPYRMHPLSVAELTTATLPASEIREASPVNSDTIDQLLEFGGFPEPLIQNSRRFYNRWKRLRAELLFREDLRDLTRIQEVGHVQVLADLLASRIGQLINYSSLAAEANVSVDTVRRWIVALESLYFCYVIRPWFRNVPKSLRKQPKIYLWDWSVVAEEGARRENLVASHLLKAVHFWTDMGLGSYGLYYVRDKAKREVDFLVTREDESARQPGRAERPWFLVEVKSSGRRGVSPHLHYFANQLGVAHAFQVAFDIDQVDEDLFSHREPIRVPAETFLSQLV